MRACEYACGSTTGCAWGGSLWEQSLRQEYVLVPLRFNIFFAAVVKKAYTRLNAHKDIMDALVHLKKKKGAGGRGEATAGEPVLVAPFWVMLYADDSGVVSQFPE